MSKKLKKFLNDAEKTESKIAELEEYLRNVRAAQKKEENNVPQSCWQQGRESVCTAKYKSSSWKFRDILFYIIL